MIKQKKNVSIKNTTKHKNDVSIKNTTKYKNDVSIKNTPKHYDFTMFKPFKDLPEDIKDIILYGSEDEEIELQRQKLAQTKMNNQPMDDNHTPQKELVNFDDFTIRCFSFVCCYPQDRITWSVSKIVRLKICKID